MLTSRQQSLLDSIRSDFLAHGFSDFTIDAASRKYHCSKATLYALGATRNDIVRRAIVAYFRDITSHTSAAITSATGPTDAVQRYFAAIAESTSLASTTFWHDMTTDPVAVEIYSANTQAAAITLANVIKEGVHSGEFVAIDPHLTAAMVSAALEAIQQRRIPASTPTPTAYKELGKLLLSGLSASPAEKK